MIEAQSIKYCQKNKKISISVFNSVATSRWRGGFAGSKYPDLDALPIVFTSTFSWIWFCRIDKGNITILEDSLAIMIEPLPGWLSDKQRHWMATRFPLIVVALFCRLCYLLRFRLFLFSAIQFRPCAGCCLW